MGWLDLLAIVSGLASIYGAYESYRQSRVARSARDAAAEIEQRVRRLGVRLRALQDLADIIANLRQAEFLLSRNAETERGAIRACLNSASSDIARVSAVDEIRFSGPLADWTTLELDIQDLSIALQTAPLPLHPVALGNALRIVIRHAGDLERLQSDMLIRTGADYASPT